MGAEGQLSPHVRAAWGLGGDARRGRPAELNLPMIVTAATRLADDGGLAAVSMTSVAKSLGFSPMSLYRHVESKEVLLELMVDDVFSAPPAQAADGWRDGLRLWAARMMDDYTDHDWILDVPVTGPPMLPKAVAWMEWALGTLAGEPLAPLEKLSVLMLVSGYVRNEVTLARGLERARRQRGITSDDEGEAYAAGLVQLVSALPLPNMRSLVDDGLFEMPPGEARDEDAFMVDFGLERILDGIAALIGRRSPSAD